MNKFSGVMQVLFFFVFFLNATYLLFFKMLIRSIKNKSPDIWRKIRTESTVDYGITLKIFRILYTSRFSDVSLRDGYQNTLMFVRILLPLCAVGFVALVWLIYATES